MTESLYKKIKNDLKRNIILKKIKNDKLPSERDLCKTYDTSRNTIRKALSELEKEGLIYRNIGSGTFINKVFQNNYNVYSHQGIGEGGLTNTLNIIDERPYTKIIKFDIINSPTPITKNLLLSEDDFVYNIKRLRIKSEGDIPFSIEESYIPIKLISNLTEKESQKSLYTFIEKELNKKITRSFRSIYATIATDEDVQLLHVKKDTPISVVEEIIFLETGVPIEYSVSRYNYKFFNYNSMDYLDSKNI